MASYDFRCTACDHIFARHMPMRDLGRVKVACPACGSTKVERVFTPFYAKTDPEILTVFENLRDRLDRFLAERTPPADAREQQQALARGPGGRQGRAGHDA